MAEGREVDCYQHVYERRKVLFGHGPNDFFAILVCMRCGHIDYCGIEDIYKEAMEQDKKIREEMKET